MKKQKWSTILVSVLVAVSLCACEDWEFMDMYGSFEPITGNSSGLKFEGELTTWNPDIKVNDPTDIVILKSVIEGAGFSNCRDLSRFDISQTHVTMRIENGIQIKEGRFNLYNESCSLSGTYTGYGNYDEGYMDAELILKIEEGTEYYLGSTGSITVKIEADQNVLNAFLVQMSGRITCPQSEYGFKMNNSN